MAYKEKTCPRCQVKHNKRGEFCSRQCGNIREWNPEQRQAVSDGLKEWHATSDTAAVAAYNWSSKGVNQAPEPIAPPVKSPLKSNQFVQDGDLWEET